jgi:hypothetical protein
MRIELRASNLLGKALDSHPSPLNFFYLRLLYRQCLVLLLRQTFAHDLAMSASQVAGIIGMNHHSLIGLLRNSFFINMINRIYLQLWVG